MPDDKSRNNDEVIGFVTVIHVPELGHCGGLLLLNLIGRPVEFHCTSPVPENRAQRILYGQTYQTFLYCDQISLALTGKAKVKPNVMITDRPEILALGRLSAFPVLGIADPHSFTDVPVDADTRQLKSGAGSLWTLEENQSLIEEGIRLCESFIRSVAIDEPFERVRQAIEEAQTVAR